MGRRRPGPSGHPNSRSRRWHSLSRTGHEYRCAVHGLLRCNLERAGDDEDPGLIDAALFEACFCEVIGGTVFRLTPDKKFSNLVPDAGFRPAGLAVHKNGRIYMAELGDFSSHGSIISMAADGTDVQPARRSG
ncbi:hypothetical protein AGR4B_pAt10033 [Agrobacterium tumefaciens str. CFBP 5621]|nr:hypothetical protein AGR4B_pAt10033 [Agrobacterium tumefaciens str. CFBP 5621]